jgi:hypothetical protein
MTTTIFRGKRLWLVALFAVMAMLVGLLAAYGSGPRANAEPAGLADTATATNHTITSSETALEQGMRALWEQHMEWTYATIAAFAVGSHGYSATAGELLHNQVEIGDAIKPFYGNAAGEALTKLLTAHITGFVAILEAAKAGNTTAEKKAVVAEYANAKQIGDFLHKANPDNWPRAAMERMMKTHITQTLVYATDQLVGKYTASIKAYLRAETHMLAMSDMLSSGLIAQFPQKFTH